MDPQQPIFVLCSVHLDESSAKDIVDRHRGRLEELKYSTLRKSTVGQRAIAAVINETAIRRDTVFLSMALKPWMMAGKFVDLLVEPYFHARRRNMYAGGLHFAMSNALYERGGTAMGKEVWADVQTKLVDMMKRPTEETRTMMLAALTTAREACSAEEDGIAAMLDAALSFPDITEEIYAGEVKHQLDPAPTALSNHVGQWSEAIGPHRVIHDHSDAVSDWQPYIESLSDPSMEPTVIDYGHTELRLPLQCRAIEMVDSKDHPAVQIADILAGALAALSLERFGARKPDDFIEKLGFGKLPSLVRWSTPPLSPYWFGERPGD